MSEINRPVSGRLEAALEFGGKTAVGLLILFAPISPVLGYQRGVEMERQANELAAQEAASLRVCSKFVMHHIDDERVPLMQVPKNVIESCDLPDTANLSDPTLSVNPEYVDVRLPQIDKLSQEINSLDADAVDFNETTPRRYILAFGALGGLLGLVGLCSKDS